MANGAHKITEEFEKELCRYTGAPYAIALDNASNALFLSLYYEQGFAQGSIRPLYELIYCPSHTYPSVPCEIIHAQAKVEFVPSSPYLKGPYRLWPTKVFDSALRFTYGMYIPKTHMCISFTGPYKHLKLGKGGAILTDNEQAYKWFKKARFSGRDECSYHIDDFDKDSVIGWNFYMPVETAARGLHMMPQFYDIDGNPKPNDDLEILYPDLSRFKCYNK